MPYTYVHRQTIWINCPRPAPLATNNPYRGGVMGYGTQGEHLLQVGIYTQKILGTTTKCSSLKGLRTINREIPVSEASLFWDTKLWYHYRATKQHAVLQRQEGKNPARDQAEASDNSHTLNVAHCGLFLWSLGLSSPEFLDLSLISRNQTDSSVLCLRIPNRCRQTSRKRLIQRMILSVLCLQAVFVWTEHARDTEM